MKYLLLLLCYAFPFARSLGVNNYAVLQGVAFSNTTNASSVVKTNSIRQCAVRCSAANCNAAQYSNMDGMCSMTFGCALNALNSGDSKLTIVNSNDYVVSGLPMPMLEWMMTDACESANTGWLNPGLLMQQTNSGTSTWTAKYNISVGKMFGNAIWYPNINYYGSVSDRFTLTIDFSKSLTLFAYYWLYAMSSNICLIEFAQGTTYGTSVVKLQFWYFQGGIFWNFDFAGCTGDCQGVRYHYALQTNSWTHVALVYDGTSKLFSAYLNGSQVWQSTSMTNYTSNVTTNFLVTGARSSNGQLPGTTYCLKVFQAALSANSINDVANSCQFPTVN